MSLRNQLPYLYKDKSPGALAFIEKATAPLSIKPDYASFKSGKYNSEHDCVSALIGVLSVGMVELKLEEQGASSIMGSIGDFQRWMVEMHCLLREIREKINQGVGHGDLKPDRERTEPENILFSSTLSYETLPFLRYMAENGDRYPIPNELFFYEAVDGSLRWLNPVGEAYQLAVYVGASPDDLYFDYHQKIHKEFPRSIKYQSSREGKKTSSKREWAFINEGDVWSISFEGQTIYLKDSKPVQCSLEVIKNVGSKVGYVELGQILSNGLNLKPKRRDDELHCETKKEIYTAKEKWRMKDALGSVYIEYIKDPDKHKDNWEQAIQVAKNYYGILVTVDNGELKFKDSKWNPHKKKEPERVRKLMSRNIHTFLKRIKKVKHQSLYNHFKQSFVINEGGILYSPPENSPDWIIKEK